MSTVAIERTERAHAPRRSEVVMMQRATPDEDAQFLDHQAMLALEGKEYAAPAALTLMTRAYNDALERVKLGLVASGGLPHEALVSPSLIRNTVASRLTKVARSLRMPDDIVRSRIARLHLHKLSRDIVKRRKDEASTRAAQATTTEAAS